MHSVGWGFLLIIVLSGFRLLVRAWAWTLCTPSDGRTAGPRHLPRLSHRRRARQPDAARACSPARRRRRSTSATVSRSRTAVSGLTIENLIYTMTVAVVIVSGTLALLWGFRVSHNLEVVFLVSVGVMLAMLVAAAWIVGRQIKVMTGLLDWLHRRALAPQALAGRLEKLRTLEDAVYGFHRQNPARLLTVVALEGRYHACRCRRGLRDAGVGRDAAAADDRVHPRDGEPPDQRGLQVRADAAGGGRGRIRRCSRPSSATRARPAPRWRWSGRSGCWSGRRRACSSWPAGAAPPTAA